MLLVGRNVTMKRIFVIICLLFLTDVNAQTPSQADSSSWKKYSVRDEQFSIALPTLPAMHTSRLFFEPTRKYRTQRLLGSYADGVVYTILILEDPNPRESLKDFIAKNGYGLDLTTGRNVVRDGFAGKEFSSPTYLYQFFATENRLYRFQATTVAENDPRVRQFVSSVSLNSKEGLEVIDGPGEPFEAVDQSPPSEGSEPSKNYTGKEVDKKARLGMKPEPSYTESARAKQIAGTVVLRVVFSSNGMVTNVRVISGLPDGLTEKAIDAARKIKFIPAIKNGNYVSMWMQLEYNFNLY
jgi:TonB family protein